MISSGLFVRFREVFEGFLPARRLPGDFFEMNASTICRSSTELLCDERWRVVYERTIFSLRVLRANARSCTSV
jgi:hypothetical protein